MGFRSSDGLSGSDHGGSDLESAGACPGDPSSTIKGDGWPCHRAVTDGPSLKFSAEVMISIFGEIICDIYGAIITFKATLSRQVALPFFLFQNMEK